MFLQWRCCHDLISFENNVPKLQVESQCRGPMLLRVSCPLVFGYVWWVAGAEKCFVKNSKPGSSSAGGEESKREREREREREGEREREREAGSSSNAVWCQLHWAYMAVWFLYTALWSSQAMLRRRRKKRRLLLVSLWLYIIFLGVGWILQIVVFLTACCHCCLSLLTLCDGLFFAFAA